MRPVAGCLFWHIALGRDVFPEVLKRKPHIDHESDPHILPIREVRSDRVSVVGQIAVWVVVIPNRELRSVLWHSGDCTPVGAARSIVLAPAPQRGDMDFSAYRVSRRVYKCTALQIDGDHCMRSRFVSAENHYPVVPSNDLVP